MQLLGIELQEKGASCESCGHEIKWKYTISLDTGRSLVVGSDCANRLLSKEDKDILQRRANAAAREWRKQEPAPRENETRQEYITRRIAEKSNALAAWQGYMTLLRKLNPQYGALHLAAQRNLEKRDIYYPRGFAHDEYGFNERCQRGMRSECPACQQLEAQYEQYHQQCKAEENAILSSIEQQYQASRFDFTGKAAYEIKKV